MSNIINEKFIKMKFVDGELQDHFNQFETLIKELETFDSTKLAIFF